MQDLSVTIFQQDLAWQDAPANRAQFARLLPAAAGSALVVLPAVLTMGLLAFSASRSPRAGRFATASCSRARTLDSSTTTSATCSAWPASITAMCRAASGA